MSDNENTAATEAFANTSPAARAGYVSSENITKAVKLQKNASSNALLAYVSSGVGAAAVVTSVLTGLADAAPLKLIGGVVLGGLALCNGFSLAAKSDKQEKKAKKLLQPNHPKL